MSVVDERFGWLISLVGDLHVLGTPRSARRSIEDEEIISRENELCFMLYVPIFYHNSLDDVGVSILVQNVLRKPRRMHIVIIIHHPGPTFGMS